MFIPNQLGGVDVPGIRYESSGHLKKKALEISRALIYLK
jgi:hypothetical protein